MRHLLTCFDLSIDDVHSIFTLSEQLKADLAAGVREPLLTGRVLALLFEKPSLRTRVSFEAGMAQLGGSSLFLGDDVGWGKRETVSDFARVLCQYVDAVVFRTKSHDSIEQLAAHAEAPIINGLSDLSHPCQALADLFTLKERYGDLAGRRLAFIGDGNNVARSLAVACRLLDVEFILAAPEGYGFDEQFVAQLAGVEGGGGLVQTEDPSAAATGASAVYTDVWASMGQEQEQAQRIRDFTPFQVNAKLMAAAPGDAIFLHCLPARRGEEVTDEVIDSEQSAVIQQAGNRMHVQKGVLAWLLG